MKVDGGTGLLFARVCSILQMKYGYELSLVDYEKGAVARYFNDNKVCYTHLVQRKASDVEPITGSYDYILSNLLSSKSHQSRIIGNDNTRVFFWMTFPADAYKWLPLSTICNGMPLWWRRLVVYFHISQSKRIGRTLSRGMRAKGIALMDEECWRFTRELFHVEGLPNIVPICSGVSPSLINRNLRLECPEIVWIGRLADFKTAALCNVLSAFQLHLEKCPLGVIHIIGDGADRHMLESLAPRRFANLKITFHGHLPIQEIKNFLEKKADIFIGHGTSLIEAASLGIPSLVVDPSYVVIDSNKFLARWFVNEKPGSVGRIVESVADYQGLTWPVLFAIYMKNPVRLGLLCRSQWDRFHNPYSVAERVNSDLSDGTYTLKEFREDGGSLPGIGGQLIEGIKRAVKCTMSSCTKTSVAK